MLKINVKELVDANFDNINQFAKAIGIGYQPAENIYNGTVSRIGLDTLDAMCNIFNCTPNDILISDESKSKNDSPKKKNVIRVYHAQSNNQEDSETKTENSSLLHPQGSVTITAEIPNKDSRLHKMIYEIVNQEIDRKMGTGFIPYRRDLKKEMHEQSWRNVIKENPDLSKGGK